MKNIFRFLIIPVSLVFFSETLFAQDLETKFQSIRQAVDAQEFASAREKTEALSAELEEREGYDEYALNVVQIVYNVSEFLLQTPEGEKAAALLEKTYLRHEALMQKTPQPEEGLYIQMVGTSKSYLNLLMNYSDHKGKTEETRRFAAASVSFHERTPDFADSSNYSDAVVEQMIFTYGEVLLKVADLYGAYDSYGEIEPLLKAHTDRLLNTDVVSDEHRLRFFSDQLILLAYLGEYERTRELFYFTDSLENEAYNINYDIKVRLQLARTRYYRAYGLGQEAELELTEAIEYWENTAKENIPLGQDYDTFLKDINSLYFLHLQDLSRRGQFPKFEEMCWKFHKDISNITQGREPLLYQLSEFRVGVYRDALKPDLAEHICDSLIGRFGNESVPQLVFEKAAILRDENRYDSALYYFKEAERAFNDEKTGRRLQLISAKILFDAGKRDKALQIINEVSEKASLDFSEISLDNLIEGTDIVSINAHVGNMKAAEKAYTELLESLEKRYKDSPEKLLDVYYGFMQQFVGTSLHTRVMKLSGKLVSSFENLPENTSDSKRSQYAQRLMNFYDGLNKPEKALEYCDIALEATLNYFDVSSEMYVSLILKKCGLLINSGRHKEALAPAEALLRATDLHMTNKLYHSRGGQIMGYLPGQNKRRLVFDDETKFRFIKILNMLCRINNEIQHYSEAEYYAECALEIAEYLESEGGLVTASYQLALQNLNQSMKTVDALLLSNKAESFFKERENYGGLLGNYLAKAEIYEYLNDSVKVAEAIANAAYYFKKYPNTDGTTRIRYILAASDLYQESGEAQKAAALYYSILGDPEKNTNFSSRDGFILQGNYVRFLIVEDSLEKAERLFKPLYEAKYSFLSEGEMNAMAMEYSHSMLLMKKGEYKKAEKKLLAVKNEFEKRDKKRDINYFKTSNLLAEVYEKQGKYKAAFSTYEDATESFVRYIFSEGSSMTKEEQLLQLEVLNKSKSNLRRLFFSRKEISENKDGEPSREYISRLLEIEELSKGVLLNAEAIHKQILLYFSSKEKRKFIDPALKEAIDDWKLYNGHLYLHGDELKEINNEYALLVMKNDSASLSRRIAIEQKADSLRRENGEGVNKVIRGLENIGQINTEEVKNTLQTGEALVRIIKVQAPEGADNSHYYAFIARADKPIELVKISEKGKKMETLYFQYYKNGIDEELEDLISYNNYWRPLEQHLEGIEKVYFIPDGVYNLISLESLINNEEYEYLIDYYKITYLTSVRDLFSSNTSSESSSGSNYVLVGDPEFGGQTTEADEKPEFRAIQSYNKLAAKPLPATRDEVENIRNLFEESQHPVIFLTGREASEDTLKNIEDISLLHMATHGFFMPEGQGASEDPMLKSGVLLSGVGGLFSEKEDGLLMAYEVLNMDLQTTDLVVLSACETGVGALEEGEGVYGLRRAFRIAGAETLIMSLWEVNDEVTEQLMTAFYGFWLKDGLSKKEAFRKAQLLVKEEYEHPNYWAAFLLIGKGR